MIRALRDAMRDLAGWLFHGFVEFMWPKHRDDDTNKDGEPDS